MPTVQLTNQMFIDEVFDYTTQKEWKFKGAKPAIIDFYADWCGPCKMVAPILEELSNELSAVFQIRSIPSMLFIPLDKQPMMQAGALPKGSLKEIIEKELI
jgi:thiol-disulfide isomerase/thioredoxin